MTTEVAAILPSRILGRWRRLGDRAVFRLTGSDRVRYLNGQVSNDVAKLGTDKSIAACLCTIKGKVEALIWIQEQGETLIIDGELRQRAFLAARLERYLIADDCLIEDITGTVCLIHHFAEGSPGVSGRRIVHPGKDLFLQTNEAVPLPAAMEIGDAEWGLLETLSLTPRSGCEITGEEFPAELRLDTWAVDFHKGCYLGQEIISRIRSVGKIHRSLHLVIADSPVTQGETLIVADGSSGTATRSSNTLSEKKHLTLAILGLRRRNSSDSENQRLVEKFETTAPH